MKKILKFVKKNIVFIIVILLFPMLFMCFPKSYSLTYADPVYLPEKVFAIINASITDSSIEIIWSSNIVNEGYVVSYRLAFDDDWEEVEVADKYTFSYTLDNLDNATSVEFRVRSYNSEYEYSEWSEIKTYTTNQGELKTSGFHFYVISSVRGYYYSDYKNSETKSSDYISAGTGYEVEDVIEYNDEIWFKFKINNQVYYIKSDYCLVNLEEFLPALIYNVTNSYSCIYQSSGYELSITGSKLYSDEYVPSLLYSTAVKLYYVEALALMDNNTIVVYDAYRPRSASSIGAYSLNELYNSNSVVRSGINQNGYGQSWFVAQSLSSHNLGVAVDVTLANNFTKEESADMPSSIQELSAKAIKYSKPCYSYKEECTFASSMTDDAMLLHSYFTEVGFADIASEWWHFQEYATVDFTKYIDSSIRYSGMDFWSNVTCSDTSCEINNDELM